MQGTAQSVQEAQKRCVPTDCEPRTAIFLFFISSGHGEREGQSNFGPDATVTQMIVNRLAIAMIRPNPRQMGFDGEEQWFWLLCDGDKCTSLFHTVSLFGIIF